LSRIVVFIHGMYLGGSSWQPWINRAASQGRDYTCHAPSWPYHDGAPEQLRAAMDPALGTLTFGQIIDYYKEIIDALREKPVLVGHSVGGLVVQKLINGGYGMAGVAVSPATPRGVLAFGPNFLRANFPHLNPLAGNRPIRMTARRFHYAFGNTMTRADSDAAFEAYTVPESRNVPRSTLTRQAAIDFTKPHPPMLIITADKDHLTPRAMIKRNVRKYPPAAGTLDFAEFRGRSHLLCGQTGWEEVADHVFAWIDQH
jgi:pimeloyl-ACP methyl ester carboxylesterase